MNEEIKKENDNKATDQGTSWGLHFVVLGSIAVFLIICIQAYMDNH